MSTKNINNTGFWWSTPSPIWVEAMTKITDKKAEELRRIWEKFAHKPRRLFVPAPSDRPTRGFGNVKHLFNVCSVNPVTNKDGEGYFTGARNWDVSEQQKCATYLKALGFTGIKFVDLRELLIPSDASQPEDKRAKPASVLVWKQFLRQVLGSNAHDNLKKELDALAKDRVKFGKFAKNTTGGWMNKVSRSNFNFTDLLIHPKNPDKGDITSHAHRHKHPQHENIQRIALKHITDFKEVISHIRSQIVKSSVKERGVLLMSVPLKYREAVAKALPPNLHIIHSHKGNKQMQTKFKQLFKGTLAPKQADSTEPHRIDGLKYTNYAFTPVAKRVRAALAVVLGPFGYKVVGQYAELNHYYDIKKCGIGLHGDIERGIARVHGGSVNCVKVGPSIPLYFTWFRKAKIVGDSHLAPHPNRVTLSGRTKKGHSYSGPAFMDMLGMGDAYFMSENATGWLWKDHQTLQLRHAAGFSKKHVDSDACVTYIDSDMNKGSYSITFSDRVENDSGSPELQFPTPMECAGLDESGMWYIPQFGPQPAMRVHTQKLLDRAAIDFTATSSKSSVEDYIHQSPKIDTHKSVESHQTTRKPQSTRRPRVKRCKCSRSSGK